MSQERELKCHVQVRRRVSCQEVREVTGTTSHLRAVSGTESLNIRGYHPKRFIKIYKNKKGVSNCEEWYHQNSGFDFTRVREF